MNRALTILLALVVLGGALSGCISKKDAPVEDLEQQKADEILGDQGRDKLVEAATLLPKNYSFPEQAILPQVKTSFVGQVTSEATGSYEGERDESGIDYHSVLQWYDVSQLVPAGQPVELVLRLVWDASEANSADLDLAVDVPGLSTTHSPTSETFNWNLATKTIVVNTVGVAGLPAQVGVQISSGIVTQGFDYTLEVQATYVKDVLTPYHPWALEVPSDASGLVFESEKAGGEEHLTSQFIVIDPDDNLVQFIDFNDIDIPTQSVFVPTTKGGTYVFYAYSMHGGFLRVKADVPLEQTVPQPLALKESRVVDAAAPTQPGLAGKDIFNGSAAEGTIPTEDVNPVVVDFTPEGAFPLRVSGFIEGPLTTMAKITLKSPNGEVHRLTKIARYEDERGSLGYTGAHEGTDNNRYTWRNVAKGTWTAEIVHDSPGVEIGHTVLTYAR